MAAKATERRAAEGKRANNQFSVSLPDLRGGKPVQCFGDSIRLATGRRIRRTESQAVVIGGSVLLPTGALVQVLQAIRKSSLR